MRLLKAVILFCTIFFLFFLVSCIETEDTSLSRAEILAGTSDEGRSYFISSAIVNLNDEDLVGSIFLNECVTDNTLFYFPQGRYEENEGRTKCQPDDPIGATGSWTLDGSSTQLIIEVDGALQIWEILNINSQEHSITRPIQGGDLIYTMERVL